MATGSLDLLPSPKSFLRGRLIHLYHSFRLRWPLLVPMLVFVLTWQLLNRVALMFLSHQTTSAVLQCPTRPYTFWLPAVGCLGPSSADSYSTS